MAPKIFITGSTGYIGGSVLHAIVKNHPEYDVTALLRNEPPNFRSLYPDVRVVKGDYDSAEVLSTEAGKADVVVHCGDSDHIPSIRALLAGTLTHTPQPSFIIHLSGTGLLADWSELQWQGRLNPQIWSDTTSLPAITSLPDSAFHRPVDKLILAHAAEHGNKVKTAIVCPPDIYGEGSGPGRRQSLYFPLCIAKARELGHAFFAGDGANRRSIVHVEDLMGVYLRLVEAAVDGGRGADCGSEGYYFVSAQEVSQLDVAKAVGELLHSRGLVGGAEPKSLSVDEVNGLVQHPLSPYVGRYLFASNSRSVPDRAGKLFGYRPRVESLEKIVEADLDVVVT